MHVYFTGDEREYLKYSRLNLDGSRPSSRDFANPVRIRLADEKEFTREGRMDFVANTLDEASGTIQGRALFDNSDGLLTPGLFVTVQLLGRGPYEALLIPAEAIGADQSQAFVYVVGDGNVVQRRLVDVGRLEKNLRVIEGGLSATDRVVINGLPRVRPGAAVDPQLVDIRAKMRAAWKSNRSHNRPATMNIGHYFIDRPRAAAVISIFIVLVGLIAYGTLPISQYPEISPPTIVVRAVYPGATAEVVAQTVATPIEQEVNGVERMLYMTSQSTSDGVMSLSVVFELGTDLDTAQVLVQNRISVAEPRLPEKYGGSV